MMARFAVCSSATMNKRYESVENTARMAMAYKKYRTRKSDSLDLVQRISGPRRTFCVHAAQFLTRPGDSAHRDRDLSHAASFYYILRTAMQSVHRAQILS